MAQPKKKVIYALYRGENNVCDGTLKEISQKTGLSLHTLRWYLSPVHQKMCEGKPNRTALVYVGVEYGNGVIK